MGTAVLGVAVLVAVTLIPLMAGASHFRYGHYTWKPLTGTTIEFTLQNGFRRDGYTCINPATLTATPCSGPGIFPGVGDVFLEFIGATTFNPGDGTVIGSPLGSLLYVVTSIDPANDWLFALALDPTSLPAIDTTITHTYAGPGTFTAFTASCCRISPVDPPNAHINNPDGFYRVETTVTVGGTNTAPASALPPIVNCPIGGLCSFVVPVSDVDGDATTCRLSTSAEAGAPFVQPGPPHATNAAGVDPDTCVYTWDTTGATLGAVGLNTLYSTQVTIEDRDALGTIKNKVALDFLIQLVPGVPPPPGFDSPPTLACGSSPTVTVGGLLTFTVQASDPAEDVTLNVAGLPAGATMTPPLPTTGNPVSSDFAWTPSAAQEGNHVVTFTATDTSGLQALCSYTLVVTGTPTCNGLPATIYVGDDGIIVGGPNHGRVYRGVLDGTDGDDVIVGTSSSDLIRGFGGNDTICGDAGRDIIEGGSGDDWIDGGPGDDLIKGQEGNDELFGGTGNDIIEGGPGDDHLDGGDDIDLLKGQQGTDTCANGETSFTCEL